MRSPSAICSAVAPAGTGSEAKTVRPAPGWVPSGGPDSPEVTPATFGAVGKDDERSGGLTVGERLKHHVVAALRFRRAIPRAVESDKSAALITGGERLARIDQKIVRRPMTGKGCNRRLLAGADADLFAVAAIFRRQHELVLQLIVVAFRPAVVGALLQQHDLLGRQLRALPRVEVARPVLRELIAAVLRGEETSGGVEREAFAVAQPRGVALRRGEMLIFFVGVVEPDAGATLELR